ncbi:hypothetical protein BTN33_07630 [Aeromonas veronii]|uniref:hypothetical protein n=1 Tax=Aeromonas veronii TaxID=654 RepID=UPI000946CB18|nr:hypothetical protein [Aeromonas veronii]OLF59657.1 hypothetical protein BTN33_07630 [Aeromonas veronii]
MSTQTQHPNMQRKKPQARTTAILWGDVIPKADALTIHFSKQAGFALTRTQMLNALVNREFDKLRSQGELAGEVQ